MKSAHLNYPTLDVATKYGNLVLTFLHPIAPILHKRDGDRHVGKVTGELTINGITAQCHAYLYWITRTWNGADGSELATPVPSLHPDYVRIDRLDRRETTYGMHTKFRDLLTDVVQHAYEAHPELQKFAERTFLWNNVIDQEDKRDEIRKTLDNAESAVLAAQEAFEGWGKSNG